jgi:aspartate racemase
MKDNTTNELNRQGRRKLIALFGTAGTLGLFGFSKRHSGFFTTDNKHIHSNNNDNIMNNHNTKLKTIGILGGVGPQATVNFEEHIHLASRELIPPLFNSGYPPMIVFYHRHAPIQINKDLTPVFPLKPDPGLLDAAKRLGTMVDFLVITSNGVHAMQKEIEEAAGRKILSMIDATLEEVKKKQWKKVGVVGYKNAMIYINRLKEMGIEFETIDSILQEKLDTAIMRVMEGRDDANDKAVVMEIVNNLRGRKVDGIIPGCTELPLLLGENMNAPDLVNPARLLAEAAVQYSLS